MKTLVVEDEFMNRIVLQKFLSKHGEVQACVNGKEAIEAFQSSLENGDRFDLICMDVMMPEMDGRTALIRIREAEAQGSISGTAGVKIIMTTGLDESDTLLDGVRNLYDGILVKPVRLDTLTEALVSLGLL